MRAIFKICLLLIVGILMGCTFQSTSNPLYEGGYYYNGCCNYGYYNNRFYGMGCNNEGCYNLGCCGSSWR